MNNLQHNTAFIRCIKQSADSSIERIRQHPFIMKGNNKTLSLEQALRWVMCAGRESKSFPEIIQNMITKCDNEIVMQILNDNLNDEYGSGNPEDAHFQHYLHLLDELGVTRSEFDNYNEKAGIKLALSLAYNTSTQNNIGIAIGYMIVNEGITCISYSSMKSAFQRFFPAIKTPFFDVHIEVDEHHVAELYKATSYLNDSFLDDIIFGIEIGERGMAVLLDEALGVYDYH
jgi:pyrroloquinoline quinone (PQQ) biosynthesis protein C